MTPDLRFTCPRCGSSSFGSSIDGPDPEGPMTRLCHGIVGNRNCGFWWPQKDDWRYFAVDGRRLGRKEYDQAMERLRAEPLRGEGEFFPFRPEEEG